MLLVGAGAEGCSADVPVGSLSPEAEGVLVGWGTDVVAGAGGAAASGCAIGGVVRGEAARVCCLGAPEAGESVAEVSDDRWGVGGADAGRAYAGVCSFTPPMLCSSGAVAALAWSGEFRSIAVRVRPPPTSATAVATAARRLFFFQRASWRRRAARPSRAMGTSPTSVDAALSEVSQAAPSSSPGNAPSCHVSKANGSWSACAGGVPSMLADCELTRPVAGGAMSGA
ncbi:hypothetical protein EJC51_02970 [Streptomyces aquilus]|uniref:Uncharacterized protein n=1 Tax=Streptomyces aquilus TaxID=2548456 RepID=A0A3S5HMI0_9ACTN|nr:hypothetical protein EJC51_02970 [Streptomyces aquilus]